MTGRPADSTDAPMKSSHDVRADLYDRYRRGLASPDPLERATSVHQIRQLQRQSRRSASGGQGDPALPSSALRDMIEQAVGRLHERTNGDLEGPCPWHASTSGRCLVLFAGGTRWWCRSCRRGGDTPAWLALVEGLSVEVARRRLGLAPRSRSRVRRQTLRVEAAR
jgi:hypothetical protein